MMKLRELYQVLNSTDTVRVFDMDPRDAGPGDSLFDGFVLSMRMELGELFDASVILVTGSRDYADIVIQIEEVDC